MVRLIIFSDPVSDAITAAIAALAEGARVDDIDSQLIDCKEPLGTVGHDGLRRPFATLSENARNDAARQLAAEAACLAHGDGGALLVGIRDDRSGLDAIVGTDLDPNWLRLRIHEMTTPPLTVAVEPVDLTGPDALGPVLIVRVLPAVEIHGVAKSDGSGERPPRWRVGRACLPMSVGDQTVFAQRVRPSDWSSVPTALTLADIDPAAAAAARALQPSFFGVDDEVMLQRLGSIDDRGRLTNGGALLFGRSNQEVLVFTAPAARGAASSVGRISYSPPLLPALADLLVRVETLLPVTMMPVTVGLRRGSVRAIPIEVVRETLANAIAHRDWRRHDPITVSVTGGSVLEAVSPGGFPFGVTESNVLAHPSRPNNPSLAHALHVLAVAERQGVGVDLMYREMIQLGHQPPEIIELGSNVHCRVTGGAPNAHVVQVFESLSGPLRTDVEISLVVHLLGGSATASADDLAELIQRSPAVASAAFDRAVDAGLAERVSQTNRWRLPRRIRAALAGSPPTATRRPADELKAAIIRYAERTRTPFARADIDAELSVGERRSRELLDELTTSGWLAVDGESVGRSVRYTRGPKWREALKTIAKG